MITTLALQQIMLLGLEGIVGSMSCVEVHGIRLRLVLAQQFVVGMTQLLKVGVEVFESPGCCRSTAA